MALVPNFSGTQSAADNAVITLTDTSTGVDLTITTRRVYIALPNGTWLTTAGVSTTIAYESWSYSDGSISLSVLPQSEAPSITVEWYAGAVLTYSKTLKFCFNLGDYIFALGLTMDQVTDNSVTQDTNWYNNKMQFIVNDQDAQSAILYGSNTTLAQNSLNRNAFMIQNETNFW